MDADQPSQPAEKQKPPSLSSLATKARATVQTTESQVGRPRQILAAAALGTCLVFIAGMLSLPQLDQPLTIALYAFVVAVPLLILYHYCASFKVDTGGRSPLGPLLLVVLVAGVKLGEMPGLLATFGGIVAVVWHLNSTAGLIFVVWTAVILVLWFIYTVVLALVIGRRMLKAERSNSPPNPTLQPDIAETKAGEP